MHAGVNNEPHNSSHIGGGVDHRATYTEVWCRSRLTNVGPHTGHHFNTDDIHSGSVSALLSVLSLAHSHFIIRFFLFKL